MNKFFVLNGISSVVLLIANHKVGAEPPAFTLDVETRGNKIPLTVPPTKQVDFSLVQSKVLTPPATIDLHLSPFIGDQGNSVTVKLVIPGVREEAQVDQLGIKVDKAVLPLRLVEANLPTVGKYTGSLILFQGGEFRSWQLELSRASVYHPAVLILDQQTVTADITRPFFGWCPDKNPEFTVRVRDKTGQWDLDGVTARLEQAPGHGFDLARNIAFKFNGTEVRDFTTAPGSPTERTVTAGHQATIGVVFKNLDAGDYNGILCFMATNSSADEAQKLTFVLHVRDSVWRAVLVLSLALVVSFVATKVITFLRNRYTLLRKITDLETDWLRDTPSVLPVVWARSVLEQSKQLSSRRWLSGLDVIESRVNQAAIVIDVLDLAHQLRDKVSNLPQLVRVRVQAALERMIGDLDPCELDETKVTDLKIKLAELAGWLEEGKRETLYWADLSKAINDTLVNVRLEDIPAEDDRAVVRALVEKLQKAIKDVPLDLQGKMESERDYARLKILWERRTTTDFGELVKLQREDPQRKIEDLFKEADKLAWQRLKKAMEENHAEIIAPTTGSRPLEAFRSLIFTFTTGSSLDHTHVVMHGLKYLWTFQRGNIKDWVVSEVPKVFEYAQDEGKLTVKVEVSRTENRNEKIELQGPEISIVKSKHFAWEEGLERVEVISLILAGIIAMVTGLSMFYFKNAAFGSLQDYLSLFLWGAAVDQTKNALQLLQSYSASPTKAP